MVATSGVQPGFEDTPSTWGAEGAALDAVAASIRGWRVDATQLAPGPATGSFRERVVSTVHLIRASFASSVALHTRAVEVSAPFQIGVVSGLPQRFLWQGRAVRQDHLIVSDGGAESHLALPPECEFTVARLDRGRLERLAGAFRSRDREPSDPLVQLHRLPAERIEALRRRLHTLLEDGLVQQREASEAALDELYEAVALALAAPLEPIRPTPETRRRTMRRAEEFMRAHAGDRLSLVDLCRAAECSERTLRYVFQERYGLSPTAFLKRLRLQGLRGDLLRATPRSATVLDLTLHWGFWHLGHLGRDYKAFFGETPAVTLRRPARAGLPATPPTRGPGGAPLAVLG